MKNNVFIVSLIFSCFVMNLPVAEAALFGETWYSYKEIHQPKTNKAKSVRGRGSYSYPIESALRPDLKITLYLPDSPSIYDISMKNRKTFAFRLSVALQNENSKCVNFKLNKLLLKADGRTLAFKPTLKNQRYAFLKNEAGLFWTDGTVKMCYDLKYRGLVSDKLGAELKKIDRSSMSIQEQVDWDQATAKKIHDSLGNLYNYNSFPWTFYAGGEVFFESLPGRIQLIYDITLVDETGQTENLRNEIELEPVKHKISMLERMRL